MRRLLALLLTLLGWAAVIVQFYLMMENRVASIPETTIRFFSFFTILTNIIVASYFLMEVFKKPQSLTANNKLLTPVTVYITIVGLVYQILLRHTWSPTGLQMVVDELLHTIVPLLAIIYWFLYYPKTKPQYKQIATWTLYPFIYVIYILIRGNISGFYPYPFINVSNLGLSSVLINAVFLMLVFIAISALFMRIKSKGHS